MLSRLLVALLAFAAIEAHGAPQTASSLTTLFTFNPPNGGYDSYGLVVAGNGTLYGTTNLAWNSTSCNEETCGTVFELSPPSTAGGPWTESTLYSFAGTGGDAANPLAPLTIGPAGVLYGTTSQGGSQPCQCGAVFEMIPPASAGGTWAEHVLYSFAGIPDGSSPKGGVVIGRDGSLLGTTNLGGPSPPPNSLGAGTIFKLVPPAQPGGTWTEVILHDFGVQSGDGVGPLGTLARATNGALYGVTQYGGPTFSGIVFELAPPIATNGSWTYTIVYSFTGGDDGQLPAAGLTLGPNGALYGTTQMGGAFGYGTIFELAPPTLSGGTWAYTTLYSFCSAPNCADGYNSNGLTYQNHLLFGTTGNGGTSNEGTIFELQPPSAAGGAWTYSVLYNFTLVAGAFPNSPLVLGRNGALYGTTLDAWNGAGTVFQFKR